MAVVRTHNPPIQRTALRAAVDRHRVSQRGMIMRSWMLTSLLLIGCASPTLRNLSVVPVTNQEWATALRHDFEDHRVRLPPNTGVMGACALGFLIEDHIAGMAVVENNARGTISVFIGWGIPPEAANTAPKDLSIVFVTRDGSEHATRFDAGGGNGLLFLSPDDVPKEELAYMEIRYPKDARWLAK